MNRDGGDKPGQHSRRAGRHVTEEEAELWRHLGRSVEKVKTKQRVTEHGDGMSPTSAGPVSTPQRPQRPAPRVPAAAPPPAAPPLSRPPAPAELDRRTLRQVAAGKVPIDDVLDLHGLHQAAAHSRLRAFLMSAQANGLRMVLIITGKGARADRSDAWSDARPTGGGQRGVLRRSVPLWLEEPELRAVVLSYASAGVRHGGDGALYVRLRKTRSA
jgi:DNA-nicking Smr family endonuclease